MKQWIKIRRDLYRQVESHVRALLGPESHGLRKYRGAYEKEFRARWKASNRDELLERIGQASIVGLADFHALQQSQRAHLRVLKALARAPRVLAVEFFEARHQGVIDRYLSGKISERELLKTIRWQNSWGFPWEHYRPVVRWAIKNKVRIFGIDQRQQKKTATTLAQRDRFAAQKVSEIRKRFPDKQIVVIYGDLHWAEKHLPAEIRRRIKLGPQDMVLVFQNSERVYFHLLEKGLEMSVDVVRRGSQKFCLLSVPPWVKWQNYLLFLEERYDRELDDGANRLDHTDHISRYVKLISQELGVETPVDHFSIYSAESPAFWAQLKQHLKPADLRWFEMLIENSVSFYIPQFGIGFLAQSSVNHAASLAMAIVHAQMSNSRAYPAKMPDDFLKLIWLEAVLYFGSKIVNPKRKTDTLIDMKARLSSAVAGEAGVEALRLALQQKMNELTYLSHGRKGREVFRPRRKVSYREAARLLGGMLGEKLFNAYRKRLVSGFSIHSLLRKSLETTDFKNVYYEMVEMIESFPEPFASKKEKM